eukprot:scaffold173178_cov26-Tisochrysis_lutea.AAC.1
MRGGVGEWGEESSSGVLILKAPKEREKVGLTSNQLLAGYGSVKCAARGRRRGWWLGTRARTKARRARRGPERGREQ